MKTTPEVEELIKIVSKQITAIETRNDVKSLIGSKAFYLNTLISVLKPFDKYNGVQELRDKIQVKIDETK